MSANNNNTSDQAKNTNTNNSNASNGPSPSGSRNAYYEVLGITATADEDEIKAAYRRLAMKWHPDKNPSPDATSKFQEISYAYRKLTTDESDSDEDIEFSAEDIFLSVFGPLFRFGRNKNSKVVFNMSDFVCPHHREFASRFFDSSSDSEWDSEDSYYDYEYDTDEDEDSDSDFFYSFHTHPPQKQAKPKEPGVPERPAPPRLLESTDVSLKVGWDVPLNNGAPILFYVLEMDTGVVAGANFNEIYRGKKRTYEVKRLTPGTTYHFLVKAANKYGAGGFSRVASFMTQGSAPKKKGANKGPAENGSVASSSSKKKKRRAKKKQAQENGTPAPSISGENGSEETDTNAQKQKDGAKSEEGKTTTKGKQTKQTATKQEEKPKGELKKEHEPKEVKSNNTARTEPTTNHQNQKVKQKKEEKATQTQAQTQPKQTAQNTKQQQKTSNGTKEEKDKPNTGKQKQPPQETKKAAKPSPAPSNQQKTKAKVQSVENGKAEAQPASGKKKKQDESEAKGKEKSKPEKVTTTKEKEKDKPKGNDTKGTTQKGGKGTTKEKENEQKESDEEVEEVNEDRDDGTVVRIRGLPWEVTKEDIAKFFSGLGIAKDGICIALNFDARPTGDGFVRFVNAEQAKAALSRHMNYMGRRYICVERSTVLGFNSCSLFAKTISDRKRQALKGKTDNKRVGEVGVESLDRQQEVERTDEEEEYFSATRERGSRSRGRGRGRKTAETMGNDPATTRLIELQALKEMGFGEEEAIAALRKGQNLELTIEWLLEQRAEKERENNAGTNETAGDWSARHEELSHAEESRRWEMERETEKRASPSEDLEDEAYFEESEDIGEDEHEAYVNMRGRDEEMNNGFSQREYGQRESSEWDEGEARDWYSQDRFRQYDRSRMLPQSLGMPGRMMPPMRPRMPGGPGIIMPGAMPIGGVAGPSSMPLDSLAREKQLSSSLWIGNVSQKVREEELRALFVPFGEIVSLKILRRSQCAFVNYSSPSAATAAKRHIQGKLLRDMRLEINFSKPPKAQRREERLPIPIMTGQRPRPLYPTSGHPGLRREEEGTDGMERVETAGLRSGVNRLTQASATHEKGEGTEYMDMASTSDSPLHKERAEVIEPKTQPPRPIERPTLPPNLRSISPPQRNQQSTKGAVPQGYSHFPPLHESPKEERLLGLHPLHSLKRAQSETESTQEPNTAYGQLDENEDDDEHNEKEAQDEGEEENTHSLVGRDEDEEEEVDEGSHHQDMRNYAPWMGAPEGYGPDDSLNELNELPDIGHLGPFSGFGGEEEMFDGYPSAGKNGPMEMMMGPGGGGEDLASNYSEYLPRFAGHMYSQYGGPFGHEQEESAQGQEGEDATTMPSSYGLFGWQPKPFGGSTVGGHLSMNIWGSETWGYSPTGGPTHSLPTFPPQHMPGQQTHFPNHQYYEH